MFASVQRFLILKCIMRATLGNGDKIPELLVEINLSSHALGCKLDILMKRFIMPSNNEEAET